MRAGVVLINFGEPEGPDPAAVVAYLERIFLANARLEPDAAGRQRARELAQRRAPGLIEEYRAMGGSPLHAQTVHQASALARELERRGHDAAVLTGMQFTEPGLPAAVESARAAGVGSVVALPLYPLTGPSTTVDGLQALVRAVADAGWDVPVRAVAGWHGHGAYTALRAAAVRAYCEDRGLDLGDPDTRLVLSAHGTPLRYLREGSRYDVYVRDHARRLTEALGVERWSLGYQNHGNRPGVEWTEPAIERVIRELDARRAVVVPISFMQEQSETLSELDRELRAEAEEVGIEFHRVPVPHDDPSFAVLLADLVEPFVNGVAPAARGLGPCRCVGCVPTHCLVPAD
jgi:ferrochelatase